MLEPGRLVLKDEDQLKAAQELGRKKVPDTVPLEACVDCVRHFMTMECVEVSRVLISPTERDSTTHYALQDESSRHHLVAFVLATVRHQDIPVVSLRSQPGSFGSGTSGRNDNVMQGLSSQYYQP